MIACSALAVTAKPSGARALGIVRPPDIFVALCGSFEFRVAKALEFCGALELRLVHAAAIFSSAPAIRPRSFSISLKSTG
jgi:hypothetical protein